jgi:hypothetical protein
VLTDAVDGHRHVVEEPVKTSVDHLEQQLQWESDTPKTSSSDAAATEARYDRAEAEVVIDSKDVHLGIPSKIHMTDQHPLRDNPVVQHYHAIDAAAAVADDSDRLLQQLLPQDAAFDVEKTETGMECCFVMLLLLDRRDDVHIQTTRRVPARVDEQVVKPTRIGMETRLLWATSDVPWMMMSAEADDGCAARLPRSLLHADHSAFSPPRPPFSFPASC